ncbi:LapA family protein [Actinomycetospora soli]|uniref:LapA family protein n=1 Tax=Actinomycetospora soli TaxID=2893887 RepID=UPI001E59AF2D|nr:lipopolysaccharide assembly protein LapA domain-containing protein [Actinomycetospora soli]MCD2189634.1 lipopolysaccharide assembly protein LapA domain-containing protein [Actinomycetospora soli]
MTEKDAAATPDLTAPSPADGPTVEQKTVARRDTPPPAERETERIPGGTAGAPTRTHATPKKSGPGLTRIGGAWVGLILGAVVLVFLLIFILQNLDPARVQFLGLQAELPLGIWMLFSAIAGVLLLAIPGLGRMIQWRRAARGPKR